MVKIWQRVDVGHVNSILVRCPLLAAVDVVLEGTVMNVNFQNKTQDISVNIYLFKKTQCNLRISFHIK